MPTSSGKSSGRVLALLSLLLAFFYCSNAQTSASVRQYACNRAAVVMIRTEVLAEVNVQKVNINPRTFNRLLDSIQRLEADSIFLSAEEKLDIVLEEFQRRPQHYFVSEFNYFRHREKVTARGSGFIISSSGFVLTNCHVVDEDDAYINRRFILSAFNYVTETNISSLEQEWQVKFTDQQRSLLNRTFANVYSRIIPIEIEKIEKKIYVVLTSDNVAGRQSVLELPAVILKKGRSMPGKDVAILKINSAFDLPAINLASDNKVSVGEEVFVYGYPNPVANNEYLSNESVLEPTLTRGIISAWKKTVNGWPVLQMDAGINHGNSGGPVCNSKGEVVGITTFGSLDDNSRGLAPGLNFAIPVEVVQEFFTDSIRPASSDVSTNFCKGLDFFNKKYYEKALHYFELVAKANPQYPTIQSSIQTCKVNMIKGNDQEASPILYFLLILLLFAVIGGLIWTKFK
ncbi:MAG: trypsin-like peptidase domain-containing protein [Chitinophagaceae bacterium]|nr:trypsin-like peptidase domain-containing protein [Chitinophagaceae bacterium]